MTLNIKNIINHFKGVDQAGQSNEKIDTLLEYNMLGLFLNGEMTVNCDNKEQTFSDLTPSDRQSLQRMYSKLQNTYMEFLSNENQISITNDNAKQYADVLSIMENSHNDATSDESYIQNIARIKNALDKYIEESQIYKFPQYSEYYNNRNENSMNYKELVNAIKQFKISEDDYTNPRNKDNLKDGTYCIIDSKIQNSSGDYENIIFYYEKGLYKCLNFPNIESDNVLLENNAVVQKITNTAKEEIHTKLQQIMDSDSPDKSFLIEGAVRNWIDTIKDWVGEAQPWFHEINATGTIDEHKLHKGHFGDFELSYHVHSDYSIEYDYPEISRYLVNYFDL